MTHDRSDGAGEPVVVVAAAWIRSGGAAARVSVGAEPPRTTHLRCHSGEGEEEEDASGRRTAAARKLRDSAGGAAVGIGSELGGGERTSKVEEETGRNREPSKFNSGLRRLLDPGFCPPPSNPCVQLFEDPDRASAGDAL